MPLWVEYTGQDLEGEHEACPPSIENSLRRLLMHFQ